MSALGQKQTLKHMLLMSALPPEADMDYLASVFGSRPRPNARAQDYPSPTGAD
jgi:hypothetical protein